MTQRGEQRAESGATVSLTTLSLVDVVRCIARVRELAARAVSIEAIAQGLMQC